MGYPHCRQQLCTWRFRNLWNWWTLGIKSKIKNGTTITKRANLHGMFYIRKTKETIQTYSLVGTELSTWNMIQLLEITNTNLHLFWYLIWKYNYSNSYWERILPFFVWTIEWSIVAVHFGFGWIKLLSIEQEASLNNKIKTLSQNTTLS